MDFKQLGQELYHLDRLFIQEPLTDVGAEEELRADMDVQAE